MHSIEGVEYFKVMQKPFVTLKLKERKKLLEEINIDAPIILPKEKLSDMELA